MISHYENDSASVEWIRECVAVETGRDELEPHQMQTVGGRASAEATSDRVGTLESIAAVDTTQQRIWPGCDIPKGADSGLYYTGYEFGPDAEVVELRCYWRPARIGNAAQIERIECNNSRTREWLWETCCLPDAVVRDLEQRISADIDIDIDDDSEPYTAEACGTREYGEI